MKFRTMGTGFYNSAVSILGIFTILTFMAGATMGQAFKHPGIRNSKEELDVIKARVNAGQEPQKSGWDKMLSYKVSDPGYQHQPCASFTFDGCRGRSMQDSAAAYSNALQWYIKGDTSKADKAIAIINDWARVTNFKQSCLAAGWSMPLMINAAEIMRIYPGWKSEDQAKFKSWLSDKLWPFASGCSSGKNNWDCGGVAISIAIAIYTDDRGRFESSVKRTRDMIAAYVKESGCTNETDRDQGHTQMGLGHLAAACEYAWQQGVDLWGHLDNRMFKGYELNAKYNLGQSISCSGGVSSGFRGNFGHTMWEIAYNHYHNRKKMDMPFTGRVFSTKGLRGTVRPEGLDVDSLPFGTLVHAELGNLDGTVPTPNPELKHTLQLQTGWNLISLPITPKDGSISNILAPINGKFVAIYAWNGTAFESHIPGEQSDLTSMAAGRGYWIYMDQGATLEVKGSSAQKSIALSEGWNLLGYNSTTSMSATQALASTKGMVEAVFSFNTAENQYQEVETFQPGLGYWVYSSGNGSWSIP
jgi:hypothetical protein